MDDYELDYDVQEVRLGSHIFKVTTVANEALPLEMLLSLQTRSEEISGQRLWEGSLLLCAYLVEACRIEDSNSSAGDCCRGMGKPKLDLQGKSVLELGAGTGIVGMLAAKLGAQTLVLTDGDDKCVAMAQKNIQDNDVPFDQALVTALRWGEEESTTKFCKDFSEWDSRRVIETGSGRKNGVASAAGPAKSLAAGSQDKALVPGDAAVRTHGHSPTASSGNGHLNEDPASTSCGGQDRNVGPPPPPPDSLPSSPSPLKSFDFILAGDVLYKHSLLEPFLGTVRDMLAAGGRMLLCHVPRAGVTYDIVERAFAQAGFAFEILNGDNKEEGSKGQSSGGEGGAKDVGRADARKEGAAGGHCDAPDVGGIELCVDDARRARLYELHSVDLAFAT
ncbi:unnamed protein product [Ectocarpus sp. 12 AP-2014]